MVPEIKIFFSPTGEIIYPALFRRVRKNKS